MQEQIRELALQILDGTVAAVAQSMRHLHKLIDNVALLDILCSLATVANRSCEPYAVPECTQSGDSLLLANIFSVAGC